jgi:hypothetical protein
MDDVVVNGEVGVVGRGASGEVCGIDGVGDGDACRVELLAALAYCGCHGGCR